MNPSGTKCQMCTDDYYQYYGDCILASCIDQMLIENITLDQKVD